MLQKHPTADQSELLDFLGYVFSHKGLNNVRSVADVVR